MTTTTTEPTYLVGDGYQIIFVANPADPNYGTNQNVYATTSFAYAAACNPATGVCVGTIKTFSKAKCKALVDAGYAQYIIG
jgi:hypothetical protein